MRSLASPVSPNSTPLLKPLTLDSGSCGSGEDGIRQAHTQLPRGPLAFQQSSPSKVFSCWSLAAHPQSELTSPETRASVENLKQKGFDVGVEELLPGIEEPRGQPGGSEESRDSEDRRQTVPQS